MNGYRLQAYQVYHQKDFLDLNQCLLQELREYMDENFSAEHARYNHLHQRFNRLFSSAADFDPLIAALNKFSGVQATDSLSKEDVSQLVSLLKTSSAKLPGALSTLCNEVLARGDALDQFLSGQKANKL